MKVRKILSAALVLLLLMSLTACGGSAKAENGAMYDAQMPAEAPEAAAPEYGLTQDQTGSAPSALPTDRKLIRTISIQGETEDLTTLLDDLTTHIAGLGGYVEAKNLRNGSAYSGYRTRNLNMTVRIPADQADVFVAQVGNQANIVSSSETIDDVTLQYVDTESHVKALETEQERLIALLEQAETLEDLLKIEDRLTQVRYELENFASRLRTLDNQVNYATIHLTITEVKEYTPVVEEETLWQRISTGFARTLKEIGSGATDIFVWILVNSPYLLILGALGIGGLALLRKKRRKITPPPEKSE